MPFAVFAIVAAISAAFSAYQSIAQGNAAAAAANFNAEQSAENAKITQQQAAAAINQGEAEKDAVRLKAAQMRAQGRTGYAAGNVALGGGTPEEFEADLSYRSEMDIDTIDTNTAMEAWGLRTQSIDYANQSTLQRMQAANAKSAGYMGAVGSLLSGASSVAGAYAMGGSGGGKNWDRALGQYTSSNPTN